MDRRAFWRAFGWTNLVFFANIVAMLVRVPIPHHMDVFLVLLPLTELVVLIGVAIWQGVRDEGATVRGILLGIVLEAVVWFGFTLFLGLLGGLGDSSESVDYFAKP